MCWKELWMPRPPALNHLRREIDTHTQRRLHRRQQIAAPTSDFQHALSRWNQKTVNLLQPSMVIPTHAVPSIALARDRIPMRLARRAISVGGGVGLRHVSQWTFKRLRHSKRR